ncbi:cation:proton antiporter [Aeromicrobium tamlense]|uniref:Cation:proton antiporter n=1 Tax=Aeromicrobium tamlense TaxID=375541 RepID=A0A8I0KN58_9ACTN|nr:cation:proton antiporter [Aeromicrobium tamlense]MBD1271898.1 cation:proton antiporter [Aeromicrobium tamlense]NYI38912.1 Kef-type K+ transport system membrane component KefB [Aeromicrobium tamlense]
MDFQTLALICVIGLLGPLLAVPSTWRIPVVVGELIGGLVVGASGAGWLDPGDETFTFLAELGFAMTMFVVGTRVPIPERGLRSALVVGAGRAALVGVAAAVAGATLAWAFDSPHAAVFAVLMASSSAALAMPVLEDEEFDGPHLVPTLTQIAVADVACILALPLAIAPDRAAEAALGSLFVVVAGVALFLALRTLEARGIWEAVHEESKERRFAVELRFSLIVLTAIAALAVATHVTVMLAGFVCGLAIAAVGPPRRLARQLFALADGFLGPVFFVWLGASLDLTGLLDEPGLIALGVCLGLGALLTHLVVRLTGLPVPLTVLTAGQVGVPVAAATIGTQTGELEGGLPAALILGALLTVAAVTVAARFLSSPTPAD